MGTLLIIMKMVTVPVTNEALNVQMMTNLTDIIRTESKKDVSKTISFLEPLNFLQHRTELNSSLLKYVFQFHN